MRATTINDILLLSIATAYDKRENVYIEMCQVESAVSQVERESESPIRLISNRVTSTIIALDDQKLLRTDRGRVYLTPGGIRACQDLTLPTEWSSLPGLLKKLVKSSV